MNLRRWIVCSLLAWASPVFVGAQAFNLRDLLSGFEALAPPPPGFPSHVDDFVGNDPDQSRALSQFNTLIANQLSSFPLASSAGGFTYTFNPSLGVFERASDSFGPVYAERVDTVGRGRFNMGLNYSHFTFDRINDIPLRDGGVQLVFTNRDVNHDGSPLQPFFEGDVITSQLSLKITSDISAFVLTYGVTDRLDVGTAIPIVSVSIEGRRDSQIDRLATADFPTIHQFPDGSSTETVSFRGQASGIGDVVLRAKYRLTADTKLGLAVGTDIRLPTGAEEDLLGTGATQLKIFLIGSGHFGAFSPHLNAGYNWSVHPSGGEHIPDELSYTAGFDWAVSPRLTLTTDVIGRTFRNAQIVTEVDTVFVANSNPNPQAPPTLVSATLPRLTTRVGNLNTLLGSVGFKINPFGNLLLTVNALFSLNEKGLADKFTPLVGLDYGF